MGGTVSEPAWKAELRRDLVIHGFLAETDEERMAVVMPHIEAAYDRGLMAGSSKAGYRLVQENARLRRELELARRENKEESCETTPVGAARSTPALTTGSGDEPSP